MSFSWPSDGKTHQSSNHEETSADTSVAALEAQLLGDLDQAGGGAFAGSALCLVDLAEHGVGGLGDEGGGETSDETGTEVDGGLHAARRGALVNGAVGHFRDLLEDDELGHGVWNP
jgi:hypothetical protein